MAASSAIVVLVSGIQGTGKTTLARAVGSRLGIGVFSRDPLMQRLMSHGIPLQGLPDHGVSPIPMLGHAIQTVILEQQLLIGLSAVLECVMPLDIRQNWAAICDAHDATLLTVECICSDRALHRDRVERRHRAGESQVTWEYASRAPTGYRTVPDADYVADAVKPVESNVDDIARLLHR